MEDMRVGGEQTGRVLQLQGVNVLMSAEKKKKERKGGKKERQHPSDLSQRSI